MSDTADTADTLSRRAVLAATGLVVGAIALVGATVDEAGPAGVLAFFGWCLGTLTVVVGLTRPRLLVGLAVPLLALTWLWALGGLAYALLWPLGLALGGCLGLLTDPARRRRAQRAARPVELSLEELVPERPAVAPWRDPGGWAALLAAAGVALLLAAHVGAPSGPALAAGGAAVGALLSHRRTRFLVWLGALLVGWAASLALTRDVDGGPMWLSADLAGTFLVGLAQGRPALRARLPARDELR